MMDRKSDGRLPNRNMPHRACGMEHDLSLFRRGVRVCVCERREVELALRGIGTGTHEGSNCGPGRFQTLPSSAVY